MGDVGKPHAQAGALTRAISRALEARPDAPVIVLGDVFYAVGLLGLCPAAGGKVSKRDCADAGAPEAQLQAIFEPYRRALAGRPVIAIAGNHDHYGGEAAIGNACRLFPAFEHGWRFLAEGCGLDRDAPVARIDIGPLVLLAIDTERMLRDPDFRRASVEELRVAVARARREEPGAWVGIIAHHPLETFGAHNGGRRATALMKDLYALRYTALLPLQLLVGEVWLGWTGQQELYEWRYRALRRELYDALRDRPIDFIAGGHDHSLQLVEIDHPGIPKQIVSGAGAYKTAVKRFGLDLWWTNRLARLTGLGEALPAPSHRLRFAAGRGRSAPRSGYGFAVVLASSERLFVRFHDATAPEPLATFALD